MKVDYAFCAKYAEVGADGLFSSIGSGLEVLQPNQLPGALPMIALVIHATVSTEECQDEHQLCVELFGPDNERLPLDVKFPVPIIGLRKEAPEVPPTFCCAINMMNVHFPSPGDYEFRISTDGKVIGRVALYMRLAPQIEVKP
jgi:hypothetical protein